MRWLHRLYALVFGYFWLPCPGCGREFGGHEHRNIDGHLSSIPTGQDRDMTISASICPTCTLEGVGDRAWAAAVRVEQEATGWRVWQVRVSATAQWHGHAPLAWEAEDIARSWSVPVESVRPATEAKFEAARAAHTKREGMRR